MNPAEPDRPVIFAKSHLLSNLIILYLLLAGAVIGGSAAWLFLGKRGAKSDGSGQGTGSMAQDAGGIKASPGPWGDLYYIPFTISAPENLLPVRTMEAHGTHWFFKNSTRSDLEVLFSGDDISPSLRIMMLAPTALNQQSTGIEVMPPDAVVLGLQEKARKRIYQTLARYPENRGEIHFIPKDTLQDRFKEAEVPEETMRIFHQLCVEHGDYLVFAGLGTMLAHLATYEEKVNFVKALTRQKTMLLQIHQKPETDIASLGNYWGKGGRATDVRTVLESLSKVKGGAWVNIIMMLPPLPASQLYTYPNVLDNPLNGPSHVRDCHWTSFNFFKDTPELDVTPEYVLKELKSNYAPASGDPRYGDVVLFAKPDGDIIHSAVYLADDIVYTKNGATAIYPWMLATIADLMKQYSFQVPDGQKLSVAYYRQKI